MRRYPRAEREKAANEARIVDAKCQHDWHRDAFGLWLDVCFKCWSTRKRPDSGGAEHG